MRWHVRRKIKKLQELDWSSLSDIEQAWLFRAMIQSGKNLQSVQGVVGDIKYLVTSNGYCHCCRRQVTFSSDEVWLRDHLSCSECNSTPRQRNLIRALDELIPAWQEKDIHETSPGSEYFKALTGYSHSQYIPQVAFGSSLPDGGTNQNIESMTFESNSFDIFISQDVLEHVFDPEKACREILRVLKPGGWHIFTTPRHMDIGKSIKRAKLVGDTIKYLKEPEYHANPVGDGKALVTYDWGKDFEKLLEKWSGCKVLTLNKPDMTRGIAGSMFEVFAIQK